MDEVLINVYRRMVIDRHCSAEDILEDPELRAEFLTRVRQELGDLPERQLLHRLSCLRKQSKLPRSREIAGA
jgi:hypothetical protein